MAILPPARGSRAPRAHEHHARRRCRRTAARRITERACPVPLEIGPRTAARTRADIGPSVCRAASLSLTAEELLRRDSAEDGRLSGLDVRNWPLRRRPSTRHASCLLRGKKHRLDTLLSPKTLDGSRQTRTRPSRVWQCSRPLCLTRKFAIAAEYSPRAHPLRVGATDRALAAGRIVRVFVIFIASLSSDALADAAPI